MKTIAFGWPVLLFFSLFFSASATEVPDTHGNRLAAARRYLEVVSMKDMMRDTIAESAKNVPDNVRSSYVQFMTKAVRVEVIEGAALASMAQHFTVQELNALADFYGSAVGQSAMKKFGAYMADIMPVIQQEMLRVQQQLESQTRKAQ